MKLAIALLTAVALATPAMAGANFTVKENGSKSNGSCVGQASSAGTGNGAVVGGNGTINGEPLPETGPGSDQTNAPGSRAAEVHAVQDACDD